MTEWFTDWRWLIGLAAPVIGLAMWAVRLPIKSYYERRRRLKRDMKDLADSIYSDLQNLKQEAYAPEN